MAHNSTKSNPRYQLFTEAKSERAGQLFIACQGHGNEGHCIRCLTLEGQATAKHPSSIPPPQCYRCARSSQLLDIQPSAAAKMARRLWPALIGLQALRLTARAKGASPDVFVSSMSTPYFNPNWQTFHRRSRWRCAMPLSRCRLDREYGGRRECLQQVRIPNPTPCEPQPHHV